MQIHWIQGIIFFVLGAFFGPMVMGLFGGKKSSASQGY